MNDTEIIQRERGWRWYGPVARDPLADTPEGWYEFGQILKWADKWCTERDAFWDLTSSVLLDDEETWGYEMVIFMRDETTYSAKHADERTARIAALAAAVRHEKGIEQ